MNPSSASKKTITPLDVAPKAFVPMASKINEIIAKISGDAGTLRVKVPLLLTVGEDGVLFVEIDIEKLAKMLAKDPKSPIGGGGGVVGDYNALLDRVQLLEAKLAGYGEVTVAACISGVATTKTFFAK
jgi:hypothetical protein